MQGFSDRSGGCYHSRYHTVGLPSPRGVSGQVAKRLGIGELHIKDESQRFGFGAFKALGGVMGVYSVLSSAVGEAYHRFALENPHAYRIMFDIAAPLDDSHPELAAQAERAAADESRVQQRADLIRAEISRVENGKVYVLFGSPDPAIKPGVTAQVRVKLP